MQNTNNFLKHKSLPIESPTSIHQLNENLEVVNEKVTNAYKRLTQWDFYRIADSVTESTTFNAKVGKLLPNTALMINCNTFTASDGDTYVRGDIVYKNTDLSYSKISAERGGIYYPYCIEKNNYNYDIMYSFTSVSPSLDSVDVESENDIWRVGQIAKKINFKQLFNNTPPASYPLYNMVVESPSEAIIFNPIFNSDDNLINPIIKMYDENNEEIYCDFTTILTDNDKIKINNYPIGIVNRIVIK